MDGDYRAEDEDEILKTVAISGFSTLPTDLECVHLLVEIKKGQHPKSYPLEPGKTIIGRKPTCDIQLQDVKVSGEHCRIDFIDNKLTVTDLNSTNGTLHNGERLKTPAELDVGDTLTIGLSTYMHEIRDSKEADASRELHEDLQRAATYIRQLLPEPENRPGLAITWHYEPCTLIGGDAFGYFPLDDKLFAFYLLDVSGHGVEAALHSSAVMNTINGRALPEVDFTQPDQVLASLSRVYHMDDHAGKYFTIWYAVYNPATRKLTYAGGGHPAVFLFAPGATTPSVLASNNPGIGLMDDFEFTADTVDLSPGTRLLLFSDGVYECVDGDDGPWACEDFAQELEQHAALVRNPPQDVYEHIHSCCSKDALDDDFTLLVLDF